MNCRRLTLVAVLALCVAALFLSLAPRTVSAQSAASSPIYNPYPPGILPPNLSAEISRVLAEVDFLESRALTRWRNMKPPILTGQPPTLQNTGTEAVETLGELMNYDKRMSPGKDQACSSCHMPYAGFSGPIPSVNLTMIAYPGTLHFRAGKRTAQRYPYAPFFPVLQYNQEQQLFFGGNFWDSRATGYQLRNPDAAQAQHPPVDTQEWASLILLASRSASRRLRTDLFLKRSGARDRSISTFRLRLNRSAQRQEGLQYSAGTLRQLR